MVADDAVSDGKEHVTVTEGEQDEDDMVDDEAATQDDGFTVMIEGLQYVALRPLYEGLPHLS